MPEILTDEHARYLWHVKAAQGNGLLCCVCAECEDYRQAINGASAEAEGLSAMTPKEAQAAYVAADDRWAEHRAACYSCGNSRLRYRPACPDGDPLRLAAWDRWQEWAQAVAIEREATASLAKRQTED